VTDGNVGFGKDLLAHGLCVENPIGLFANFLDPFITLKARLCTKYLFKPLLFAYNLDAILMKKLSNIVFTVEITAFDTCGLCHIENIPGCELAYLVEHGDEVFITRRDLSVVFEPTILQYAVESVCLVYGLTTAVEKTEDFENIGVNLLGSLVLLRVLKGGRE